MFKIDMMSRNRQKRGGVVFKIYDEPESSKDGGRVQDI